MSNELVEAFADTETAVPVEQNFRDRLQRFAELQNQRRKHEGELDEIAAEIKALEEPLLNDMAEAGIQNVNCAGLCIYKKTDFYVSKKGEIATASIVHELQRHGLGYLVSEGYNAQSLKSVIKEWRDEQREIPADLSEKLNIGETVKLATRKA